jgi:hypothetical protein
MPDLRGVIGFVYPSHAAARKDAGFLAVGFFLGQEMLNGEMVPYFVTNEHIIRDFKKIYVRIIQKGGGFCTLGLPRLSFAVDKKFDLAISRIPADIDFDIQFVMESDLLEDWRANPNKLIIGQGDDLFMLTRLVGQKTKHTTTNLVTMRFGNVSLCPEHEEPCFIAEMRSIAGHSGSPVFVYQFVKAYRLNHPTFGYRVLGINRGHFPLYEEVLPIMEIKGRKSSPTHVVATNMSMCQVVPAWKIRELLNCEKLQKT